MKPAAGGGVSVAPPAQGSASMLPAVTSQPAPSLTASSLPPSPTGPVRTSRHPAGGVPDQAGRADEPPTTAPTISDPTPLDPPPIGTRLTVTGGAVYATCSIDAVTLTGWEPAPGFTVEGVDPGPAPMAMVTFTGGEGRYQATITCVDGSPTSVVVPV